MIVYAILGALLGSIAGIIPNLHPNTISLFLLPFASSPKIGIFLLSFICAHLFSVTISSIFLGVPDDANSISALPAQRMVLKGEGYKAMTLSLYGVLSGMLLGIALFYPSLYLFMNFFTYLKPLTPFFLIAAALFIILKQKRIVVSSLLFFACGLLGILVFQKQMEQPLLPLLAGLFGFPGIILFAGSRLPKQKQKKQKLSKVTHVLPYSGLSVLTAIFPGMSSGQISSIASSMKKFKPEEFIFLSSSLSSMSFMFSFAALASIGISRNGSLLVLSGLMNLDRIGVLLIFIAFSSCLGFLFSNYLAQFSLPVLEKVGSIKVAVVIGIMIISGVFYFNGLIGLIALFGASSLGILTQKLGCQRSLNMGCLMIPVILYYL